MKDSPHPFGEEYPPPRPSPQMGEGEEGLVANIVLFEVTLRDVFPWGCFWLWGDDQLNSRRHPVYPVLSAILIAAEMGGFQLLSECAAILAEQLVYRYDNTNLESCVADCDCGSSAAKIQLGVYQQICSNTNICNIIDGEL